MGGGGGGGRERGGGGGRGREGKGRGNFVTSYLLPCTTNAFQKGSTLKESEANLFPQELTQLKREAKIKIDLVSPRT